MRSLAIILGLLCSYCAEAEAFLVRTSRGIQVVQGQSKSSKIEGYGVTFNSTVIEKVVAESVSEVNTKEKATKKEFYAWIRNCGEVKLKKKDSVEIKSGDRIKVRLIGPKSCEVADFIKY
jgi:hypothetical protein